MYCDKTADWNWMPFGVVSESVSQEIGVLDGVEIVEGKGQFWGVNVRHPVVTNGTLLHSCAKVGELIELSFGVVSEVS